MKLLPYFSGNNKAMNVIFETPIVLRSLYGLWNLQSPDGSYAIVREPKFLEVVECEGRTPSGNLILKGFSFKYNTPYPPSCFLIVSDLDEKEIHLKK